MRCILIAYASCLVFTKKAWSFQPVSNLATHRFTSRNAVSIESTSFDPDDGEGASHSAILEGQSPKAIRLRKRLEEVWTEPSDAPIILLGPKGCGKDEIAEEILERLPSWQTKTIHRLALDDAVDLIDTVLGTETQEGLLDVLASQENTTVILDGFKSRTTPSESEFQRRQELEQIVAMLLTTRTFHSSLNQDIPFKPRIIYAIHETKEPEFLKKHAKDVLLVKVPALETRIQDMALIAKAKLKVLEKEYGLRNVQLTPEAIKRLLDHTWAEGEPELDQELRKALLRLALEKKQNPYLFEGPLPWLLESKHMLVQAPKEAIRKRLLYDFPILRRIIQSPWIFDHTQRYIVIPVFIAFLAVLFLGAQTRDHSAALTVFWAGWWPAVMLSFPFLGRIWCSICPFMAVGNWAQRVATNWGIQLRKWPKWVDTWGPPFAFGLFFAILAWEELWDLPQNGALSAWLLLLITSGAVFNSVQYEDRMWCRHLCPIGAMCRTFGTMSMTEVRSFKANCQGCTNPQCVNGDSTVPDPSDSFALQGCTMKLKNNQLTDMGHCTLCMSCVKNCDKEVPEVNARPLGIDFGLPWLFPPALQDPNDMTVSQVETNYWLGALLTVLQGSVLLHYMPKILNLFSIDPSIAYATPGFDPAFYAHAALTVVLLALPGLLSLAVDAIANPLHTVLLELQNSWGKPTLKQERERNVVIESYESILRLDKSLQDTLDELDPDGDGTISCWEFERALRHANLPETQSEIVINLIRKRIGNQRIESLPNEVFLDTLQQLYIEARGNDRSLPKKVQLETKKSFVELFNELDKDGDGFIMPGDFDYLVDRNFKIQRTWEDKLELFRSADVVGQGRLNLFEFMTMMRKIAEAGIQEIGYGYLPLAWASLTAYWLGLGMKELGLTLARLPDTFYLDQFISIDLPSVAANDALIQTVQAALVIGSLPFSIGLTQKLCNDNKIGGPRFGLHAAVQVLGAWTTLYLMLSSPAL